MTVTRVVLREGSGDKLFVFAGVGGDGRELTPVIDRLSGDREVIAINPLRTTEDPETWTVETIAGGAVAMLRTDQEHGPYRLLGYSFGGAIALEVGRILRDSGESVSFLGVIDALIDNRYWPSSQFAIASLRRLFIQVGRVLTAPPRQGWHELRRLSGRLLRRLYKRFVSQRETAQPDATAVDANWTAAARWNPTVFQGRVVYFAATKSEYGIDLADLWRPYLPDLVVYRIPGNHGSMVRTAPSAQRLALAVDGELVAAARPVARALLATTFRWSGAARLASELKAAGFLVDAIAPAASALHRIDAVSTTYPLGVLRPLADLARALDRTAADLVIPFDDRMRQALDRLLRNADPATARGTKLRELLVRSIGHTPPELHTYSRADLMSVAAEVGVRCPPTACLRCTTAR